MFDNLMFALFVAAVVALYIGYVCPRCWDMMYDHVVSLPSMKLLGVMVASCVNTVSLSWLMSTPVYVTLVSLAALGVMIKMKEEEAILQKKG